nr:hypothetical protein [Pseudomonas humi]
MSAIGAALAPAGRVFQLALEPLDVFLHADVREELQCAAQVVKGTRRLGAGEPVADCLCSFARTSSGMSARRQLLDFEQRLDLDRLARAMRAQRGLGEFLDE